MSSPATTTTNGPIPGQFQVGGKSWEMLIIAMGSSCSRLLSRALATGYFQPGSSQWAHLPRLPPLAQFQVNIPQFGLRNFQFQCLGIPNEKDLVHILSSWARNIFLHVSDWEHDVACLFGPFTPMCSGTLQLPLVTMSSNSHVSSYEPSHEMLCIIAVFVERNLTM